MSRFYVTFCERLFLLSVQCFILLIFTCFLFEFFKNEQILTGEATVLKSTGFNIALLSFLMSSYIHLGKAMSIFKVLFTDFEEGNTDWFHRS